MTTMVNNYDAKTHLSRLVDRAAAGQEILLARAGKPAARLVPLEAAAPRKPGLLRRLVIPDTVFDPLPQDELAAWE